jgi:hypothetical protein
MPDSPDTKMDSARQSGSPVPAAPQAQKQVAATNETAETAGAAQVVERVGTTVAQPQGTTAPAEGWTVVLVEDNATTREEIKDYFARRLFDNKPLIFQEIEDWKLAYSLIRERKADLVILDIYKGEARIGGERVGDKILKQIEKTGFTCVILYTNLSEGLERETNAFVRLVRKTDGLPRLAQAVTDVFATKIPQMHRAIVDQLDKTLCDYMWGFVVKQWEALKGIADKPEFLRLLMQRLAISLVREGIDLAVVQVFGDQPNTAEDRIHPAEVYIKPPIGPDPLLGDVRVRKTKTETETKVEYLVVVWPSCDMATSSGRKPKTDTILCARASLFSDCAEVTALKAENSQKKQQKVKLLISNTRDPNFGSPERFHFLPGICDVPALIVDFQALEDMPLADARSLDCVASLASPFGEHLSSRFLRYIGRLGTPDIDSDLILKEFTPVEQGENPPSVAIGVEGANKG